MIPAEELTVAYSDFFTFVEPKLRVALVASLGTEDGRDATAEALTYGWEHWEKVKNMENPTGYLYRVGLNNGRRLKRRNGVVRLPPVSASRLPWVEPDLPMALSDLTEHQRVVVILVHSLDWRQTEVAELLGISVGSVRKHLDRGLGKLRRILGVTR